MLADFGLSRDVKDTTITSLQRGGEKHFKAPELYDDAIPQSKTIFSDIWAFGMFMYQVSGAGGRELSLTRECMPDRF